MTTQLKNVSPHRLCSKRTLVTTSSISYELIQPNNKSQMSVCVCSPALFLLLCKRYYEETGSNLNTKPTEKSPFFISYKRYGNYLIIGSFDILSKKELQKLLLVVRETPSSRGKLVRLTPAP